MPREASKIDAFVLSAWKVEEITDDAIAAVVPPDESAAVAEETSMAVLCAAAPEKTSY